MRGTDVALRHMSRTIHARPALVPRRGSSRDPKANPTIAVSDQSVTRARRTLGNRTEARAFATGSPRRVACDIGRYEKGGWYVGRFFCSCGGYNFVDSFGMRFRKGPSGPCKETYLLVIDILQVSDCNPYPPPPPFSPPSLPTMPPFAAVQTALQALRACSTLGAATRVLCRRALVRDVTAFLATLATTPTVTATPGTARLLLTALLVHVHPAFVTDVDTNDVHSESRSGLARSVVLGAERVVETATNGNADAFGVAFAAYRTAFHTWKRTDRAALTDTLATSYVHLAASLDEMDAVKGTNEAGGTEGRAADAPEHAADTPDGLRTHLVRARDDLVRKAAELGVGPGEFWVRVAARTPLPPGPTDDVVTAYADVRASVATVCERAFWDAFADRLRARDTKALAAHLRELTAKVKALTPRRTDLHAEVDRAVDVDLLVQMVANDALDPATFHAVADALVARVLALQAPAADAGTRAWVAAWKATWTDGKTYAELLPPFFARLHRDLDAALAACAAIAESAGRTGKAGKAGKAGRSGR